MYDVFISFKNRDRNGNLTEDSRIAEKIYFELQNRQIETFFSNQELEKNGVGLWREAIDKALSEARILVLVGTSLDNIFSSQVKYEWSDIFLEEIIDGKKPDGRLIPYLKNVDIESLEQRLKRWQISDISSKSVVELCDDIEKYLPKRGERINHNIGEVQPPPNVDPIKSNRFIYRAGYTKLFGRNQEMEFLRSFCIDSNNLVSWTVIYGRAGTGKSKLAYEFCNAIENEGWKAFRPVHAKNFTKDELATVDRDVIICFDYIKFELDYVEDIIQFVIDKRIRYKVRFLLIERTEIGMDVDFSSKTLEYHYSKGNLELNSLNEENLIALIDDYRANMNCEKEMSEIDRKWILDTLNAVDPGISRPLFAMIITDAWIDGDIDDKNWDRELKKWDRKSALRYITNKELDRISNIVTNHTRTAIEKKQYLEAISVLIAYATFVGQISVTDILDIAHQYPFISDSVIKQMLADSELLAGDIVKGLEPDLVGEYICIIILNKLESASVEKFFGELYDRHFTEMISYLYKIYDDYTDELLSAEWSRFATDIKMPLSFTYVKNNMFKGCGFIYEMKLHEEITTISKGAFRDCNHLRKINFPNNLEIIESAAFLNCVSLETVSMPDDEKGWAPSIISIGDRAFKNCNKMKEIRIPRSVQEIGYEAFAKCEKLEKIEIPREVVTIACNTFESCHSLYDIEFKNTGKDGIVIQSEAFKGCSNLHKVINSGRISRIGKGAFENCSGLKSISLSSRLTDIAESAFKGCDNIENMDLSKTNIRRINKSVFEKCVNLKKVILPKSLSYIAAKGFYECEKLKQIYLPGSIRRIGELAFHGCLDLNLNSFGENIRNIDEFCSFYVKDIDDEFLAFAISYYNKEEVTIPVNVHRVGDRTFLNDYKLERVTFHAGISGIGKEAFRGCTRLREINGTFAKVKVIGQAAFLSCKSLEHIPKDSVIKVIKDSTFRYCTSLDNIHFNSKIEKIGKRAFSQCFSLKKIYFKDKCDYISAGAFSGCSNFMLSKKHHIKRKDNFFYVCGFIFTRLEWEEELYFVQNYTKWEHVEIPYSCIGFFENPFENSNTVTSISIPNSVKKLIKNNFANTPSLKSIELPNSIRNIPEGCFAGCSSLEIIKIDGNDYNDLKKKLQIGKGAFAGCTSLKKISIPKGTCKIENNVFYNCKSLESVEFNEELATIGNDAFCGCEGLVKIFIPASIKKIGRAAFKDCNNLKKVEGLERTEIKTIQEETFKGCFELREIEFPKSLRAIRPHAFHDCRKLEEIGVFHTDIEYIGASAFENCYMLQEFILPCKIRKIEDFTFKSCTQLKKVKIPPDVKEIGTSAFWGCNMLIDIDLHNRNKLVKIGNDAFAGCHRIETMVLPVGIKKLTRGLFKECASLKKVEFSAPINKISKECFKDCKQLEEIKTNSKIRIVEAGAFRNCFALRDILFLSDILVAKVEAFRGCKSIEKAVFNQITTIPTAMFMGCYSLKEIDFPQVQQVDNYAFYGCKELKHIPIEKVKIKIGIGAFWNCYKLEKVSFSETMNDIQPSAFRNCESIEEVRLPLGIQKIYATSFRNAKKLAFVSIPKTTKEIHKSAFRDCSSLEEVRVDSECLMMEEMAFGGCTSLYYFSFPGKIIAQQTALEGVPIKRDYQNDVRLEWVKRTERKQVINEIHEEFVNISATKAIELFLYSVREGEIYLEKYVAKECVVDVPDTINGITVAHIGDECFEDRKDIKEIRLPKSILTIGKNSFAGCRAMEKLNLPDKIRSIGEFAFKWCCNLKTLDIPSQIDTIQSGLFMCCYNLQRINIPNNVKKICEGAFWRCENLATTIPGSVEEIETGAFKGADKNKIQFEEGTEDRYFEEWPYGEEVLSHKYGKGIIVDCSYISKTQYELSIAFDGAKKCLLYPNEFDDSIKFVTDEGEIRHYETIEKIRNYV